MKKSDQYRGNLSRSEFTAAPLCLSVCIAVRMDRGWPTSSLCKSHGFPGTSGFYTENFRASKSPEFRYLEQYSMLSKTVCSRFPRVVLILSPSFMDCLGTP